MAFVRTGLIIAALVLGWLALRADGVARPALITPIATAPLLGG